VTDNVGAEVSDNDVTLKAAEETIAETAKLRQDFLLNVFRRKGIVQNVKLPSVVPQREYPKTGTFDR